MNDFNRRLYEVVRRMSAFDRYKRKKTTTTTTRLQKASSPPPPPPSPAITPPALPPPSPTSTIAEQQTASNESSQSREISGEQQLFGNAEVLFRQSAETCHHIAQYMQDKSKRQVDTTPTPTTEEHHHHQENQSSQSYDANLAQLQAEINDGWKRLTNNFQKDVTAYKELANLLRHGKPNEIKEQLQQLQRERESDQTTELSAADRRRNSFKELIVGVAHSYEESRSRTERGRIEAEEENRIRQARLQEENARAAEQARIRLAQMNERHAAEAKQRDASRERYEAEKSLIFRRIDKIKANKAWYMEWRSRRPLIEQRRDNQAANAG